MEVLYYLMIFFLPYMEVPLFEKLFILKISNILAILIMLLFFRELILGKRRLELPFLLPLLLVLVVSAVSIIQGFRLPLERGLEGASGRSAPIAFSFVTLFWMIFAVFVFWMTVNIVKRKEFLANVAKFHLVSAGLVSLWGIWTVAGYLCGINTGLKFTELDWIIPRLSSTALEPLYFGNYLLSAIPLGLGLYLTGNDIFNRHLFLFLLVAQLSALVLTFSLGAWGGFAIGAVFFAVFCYKRISLRRAGTLALILFMLFSGGWVALSRRNSDIQKAPGVLADKFANIFKSNSYMAAEDFNKVEFISYDRAGEMKPGMYGFFKITVKNTGTRTWRAKGDNLTRLSYTWIGPEIEGKNMLRIRTYLPRDISPGEQIELSACARSPEKSGEYLLVWDMIEEYRGFFQEQGGSTPLSLKVRVAGPLQYYGVSFKVTEAIPGEIVTGRKYAINIKLKNTGTLAWESRGAHPVHLGYRWYDKKGGYLPGESLRTELPRDIRPGEEISLKAGFEKFPGIPEDSVFKWDMVKEFITWFSEQSDPVSFYKEPGGKERIAGSRMNISTITERWGAWRAALNMLRAHPLLGVGLGNFSFLYNAYKPADAVHKTMMPSVNNVYLEVFAETGILGLGAFLLFVYCVLKMFLEGFRKLNEDPFKRILLFCLAACLLGIAVEFNFCGGKVLHYVWVLLGLAVAVIGMKDEASLKNSEEVKK